MALAGGMVATPAFADKSDDMMKMMDTNKNGMIEKDEYLAYQSKVFDKMAADKKGQATMKDVMKAFPAAFAPINPWQCAGSVWRGANRL
ncbi:EF-hand domain-containing protein [Propionivibrio sp.]|uniref:EF-hand domain-containing protein n=1 Tax=Propionivibrio sp. TaxID=2212460 RepID=UPI0025D5F8CA|nr:EF-hand domain-containing protein [Propionivibrio sp.]MBK7355947.1 hypothetical protein [Propionivibrio sp.]